MTDTAISWVLRGYKAICEALSESSDSLLGVKLLFISRSFDADEFCLDSYEIRLMTNYCFFSDMNFLFLNICCCKLAY